MYVVFVLFIGVIALWLEFGVGVTFFYDFDDVRVSLGRYLELIRLIYF